MDSPTKPGLAVTNGPRFPHGLIVATPAAIETLLEHGIEASDLIARHLVGDWGDLDDEDREENERALERGERLFSSYQLSSTDKLWVITEWDRSVTTILCPSDY